MGVFVSVLLPVYNGTEIVGRVIESVLFQTYQGIKLVTIDDGSSLIR